MKANRFIWYCFLIFCANIVVYWVSPGTASRYLYMLFPLATTVLFYVFQQTASDKGKAVLAWVFRIVTLLVLLTCLVLPFLTSLEDINGLWALSIVGTLFFALVLIGYWRFASHRLALFLLTVIGVRLLFDLTIVPHRSMYGPVVEEKALAYTILSHTNGAPLHLWGSSRISRTTIFYLERETEAVVARTSDRRSGAYFLAKKSEIPSTRYEQLFEFDFRGEPFALIRFSVQ